MFEQSNAERQERNNEKYKNISLSISGNTVTIGYAGKTYTTKFKGKWKKLSENQLKAALLGRKHCRPFKDGLNFETPEECAARRAKLPQDNPINTKENRQELREKRKQEFKDRLKLIQSIPKTVNVVYQGKTHEVKFRRKWAKLSQTKIQAAALDVVKSLSNHKKVKTRKLGALTYKGKNIPVRIRRRKPKNQEKNKNKNKADYEKYMRSEIWRKFSKMIRDKRGNRCEKCDIQACETKEGFLHVHHLHYDNFMHEKEEDVQALCTPCHEEAHGRSFDAYGKQK